MVILGFVYNADELNNIPKGFGYLIPSNQKQTILGVLFEHQIFPQRYTNNQALFRLMIGGSRHPDVLNQSREELIQLAQDHLKQVLGINLDPQHVFFHKIIQAIPQYNQIYTQAQAGINDCLDKIPDLHLVANYWNGISFNDCITNAHNIAQNESLIQ